MPGDLKIFGGRAHPSLTQEICDYLNLPPGNVSARNFSDGEVFCQIQENVRGSDVFVVQPTC
ncbi:MAG TPA: ribose-phosphate pyrophosphokinase-like domain-containing protein, partial [Thermoanaerobaculia bacterium]|nr:ribose-phosphate pyrophosphokinase-like domain-containing protein [Thermoanaerobaculia bacterium]